MCAVKVFLHSQSQPQYKLSIITSKVDCYLDAYTAINFMKSIVCVQLDHGVPLGSASTVKSFVVIYQNAKQWYVIFSFFVGLESGLVGQVLKDESK